MPSETPPSRVKKAWRIPGALESRSDVSMAVRISSGRAALGGERVLDKACERFDRRMRNAEHLEQRAHAAAPGADQAAQRGGDVGGDLGRGLADQRCGAGLDAEPLQELTLLDRTVHAGVDVLGAARQRFEVDMSGEIGLARILQGVGEAVARNRLEGIAGVAAGMTVIDHERGAAELA